MRSNLSNVQLHKCQLKKAMVMVLWSSLSITVASRPPLDTSTVIPALAMFSLGMPTYNGGGQHTSLSDVPVSIPNVYKYILAKLDF